jgi:hypothetical protein
MAAFDVDSMISRLLNVGMAGGRLTTQVSEQELQVSLILGCFGLEFRIKFTYPPLFSAIVSTR